MNFAERAFRHTFHQLVLIQSILVVGLAVVLFSFFGKTSEFVFALVYGGFVSIIVTILRAWRLKIATEDADIAFDARLRTNVNTSKSDVELETEFDQGLDSHKSNIKGSINALELYKGFALGYIVAIGLLVLGLGGLKLLPAAVIIGFVIAQLGHFFVRPPKPGVGRR